MSNMLSINQLMKMTGLKRATFAYHIKSGHLRATRFGANSYAVSEQEWRFRQVREYIEENVYAQLR